MAIQKITDFSAVTTLLTSDILPIVVTPGSTPVNKKITLGNFLAQKTLVTVGTVDGADYVCSGTADDVQIQEAIDTVTTNGGIVFIRAGTYNITSTILVKDNVCIQGEGRTTLIKGVAGLNGPIFQNSEYVDSYASTDVYNTGITIRDLKIDGNNSVLTTGEIAGIRMANAKKILIDHVEIINTRGFAAIYLGRNEYTPGGIGDWSVAIEAEWWVTNCLIDGHKGNANASAGIWVLGLNRVTKDVHVINNTIKNCGQTDVAADGEGIHASKGVCNVEIIGNIIHDNCNKGINIGGIDDYATSRTNNITVMGNIIYNLAGVLNTYVRGIDVGGNWDRVQIIGNIVHDINASGISLRTESVPNTSKAIVKGNIFENCGKDTTMSLARDRCGITVTNSVSQYITIEGNTCTDTQDVKTQTYGIWGGANNLTIIGNNFYGNLTGPSVLSTNVMYALNRED